MLIVEQVLRKHFTYDKLFNLVDYDFNMTGLYHELKQLQKSCYDPNYRFIFIHWDTDYYISNDQPGLTLRNLQRILKALDISNYFCLVITQQSLQDQLLTLQKQETTDEHPITGITTWLQDLVNRQDVIRGYQDGVSANIDAMAKKFICLNGVKRFHRSLIFAHLQQQGRLDQGIVSFDMFPADLEQRFREKQQQRILSDETHPLTCRLLYTDNWTRINDNWPVNDADIHALLARADLAPYKNFQDTYGRYLDLSIGLSQQAFLSIVTETVFHYPTYVLGEKTIKPIVAKRPFVLVSTPGSLRLLRAAGFETFDQWWDESYDDIADPTQRIKAIFAVIDSVLSRPFSELKNMYQEMQPVIEHNFHHYNNDFLNKELEKFDQACQSNLGYR